VLDRAAPPEACYEVYPKGALIGMMRALGLPKPGKGAGKADLLATIATSLRSTATCARVVRELAPQERAALRDLMAAGGRMDYATFTRRHGAETDAIADWSVKQPESLLGRLKCRGLLAEATIERAESVFVPAELPLDPTWFGDAAAAASRPDPAGRPRAGEPGPPR
jgi:hypothetical protein